MPRPSRHRQAFVIPEGANLREISLACATDDCVKCDGRVAVRRPDGPGRIYVTCKCPVCKHPVPRSDEPGWEY